jgi:hypothetical protein
MFQQHDDPLSFFVQIPYVMVRGNSDYLYKPIEKFTNGTWGYVGSHMRCRHSLSLPSVFLLCMQRRHCTVFVRHATCCLYASRAAHTSTDLRCR